MGLIVQSRACALSSPVYVPLPSLNQRAIPAALLFLALLDSSGHRLLASGVSSARSSVAVGFRPAASRPIRESLVPMSNPGTGPPRPLRVVHPSDRSCRTFAVLCHRSLGNTDQLPPPPLTPDGLSALVAIGFAPLKKIILGLTRLPPDCQAFRLARGPGHPNDRVTMALRPADVLRVLPKLRELLPSSSH